MHVLINLIVQYVHTYIHTHSRNELQQISSSQHPLLLTVKGEQMLK